jgi:hypothetical protein
VRATQRLSAQQKERLFLSEFSYDHSIHGLLRPQQGLD